MAVLMAAIKNFCWSRSICLRSRISTCMRRTYSMTSQKRSVHAMDDNNYENFFRYTNGRWIWDEEKRLEERYKKFDVSGLKKIAVKASGAQSCVQITKLAEGGFNKVFSLTMNDGSSLIARIPMPITGPSIGKITASEVATMDFARNVVQIPVPKVLSWSGSKDNEAQTEFILMEHAQGTQLAQVWPDLDLDGKSQIVDELISVQEKLLSVSFSSYGNLYFADDRYPGCTDLEIYGDIPFSAKQYAKNNFVIGPVAGASFWKKHLAEAFDDRGPWANARNYIKAVAQVELSKAPESMDEDQHHRLSLLQKLMVLSPYLPPLEPHLDKAQLWHWDLRGPNIFIDQGKITSVIDWQDVWAGPLLMQEGRPRLIDHKGKLMLRLPDHYEDISDKNEKSRITEQVEKSLVAWHYDLEVKNRNSVLHDLGRLPHARKRSETVQVASDLWDDDAFPLEECLIHLYLHWSELNTGVTCPIHFAAEEIEAHDKQIASWDEQAEFWDTVYGLVSRDGRTSHENYDRVCNMFEELEEEARKAESVATSASLQQEPTETLRPAG